MNLQRKGISSSQRFSQKLVSKFWMLAVALDEEGGVAKGAE
jgi:hypothetical protein